MEKNKIDHKIDHRNNNKCTILGCISKNQVDKSPFEDFLQY